MKNNFFITGMSINTPLGDNLDEVLEAAYQGKSAVTRWKFFNPENNYCKVGGDLSQYDFKTKYAQISQHLLPEMKLKVDLCLKKSPWAVKLSILVFLDSYIHAGLHKKTLLGEKTGIIVCGTNLNLNYHSETAESFKTEPDFIDPLFALSLLDTNHAAILSEISGAKSFAYTVGAACASGTVGIQQAISEIKSNRADRVFVVAPLFDYSPLYLHGLAMMGAVSITSFNDSPTKASRPFDSNREGFVPAHGGAVILIESAESAKARNATVYSEIVGVEVNSSALSSAAPMADSYLSGLKRLFETSQIKPQDIDFISAHATSTPQGDVVEISAIKEFFKDHAKNLKINAPKSILGHTTSSSAIVELVLAILQMNKSKIHRSINVDELDPKIDLDICRDSNKEIKINYLLKNAFGFGGLNSFIILKNTQERL